MAETKIDLSTTQKESQRHWVWVGIIAMIIIGFVFELMFIGFTHGPVSLENDCEVIISYCLTSLEDDCAALKEYLPIFDLRFHVLFLSAIFLFFGIRSHLDSIFKNKTKIKYFQLGCIIILNGLFFVYSFDFFEIFENIFYFLEPEHLENYFLVLKNNIMHDGGSNNIISFFDSISTIVFIFVMPFAMFVTVIIINICLILLSKSFIGFCNIVYLSSIFSIKTTNSITKHNDGCFSSITNLQSRNKNIKN